MASRRYKVAGKVVEINSLSDGVHTLWQDYRCDLDPDFSVTTSAADIEFEREKSAAEDRAEGHPVRSFSDVYLESLAVYRKIAEKMIDYDTVLFHGSAIAVDGEGYLFAAESGTGKSTHARLWREYFGDRAVMINDDKPLISVGERITVCGTPYNGKHGLGNNITVPLKAVCLLSRAAENSISPVGKSEAYAMLVRQVYRPADPEKLLRTLKLTDRLADGVKLYRLGCNMDISAAAVAFEGMQ